MTLLDAPAYNASRARLIRNIGIGAAIAVVLLAIGTWWFWDWPEEHRINNFMSTVETGDLEKAYAMWNADPGWKQHPDKYSAYDFGRFQKDWGAASDYGVIKSHQVLMAKTVGNGVVIGLTVNGGKTPLFLRVQHKTHEIGFSPVELYYGP